MGTRQLTAIPALVLLLGLSSCSRFFGGRIHSEHDEFMNSGSYSLEQKLPEKDRSNNIENATVTYTRGTRNDVEIVEVYFSVPKTRDTQPPERTGYVKTGERITEVPLRRARHTGGGMTADAQTSVNDTTGIRESEILSSGLKEYTIDKFSIRLKPEDLEAIRSGSRLSFRFYFGPETGTFNVRGARLNKVRKLMLK